MISFYLIQIYEYEYCMIKNMDLLVFETLIERTYAWKNNLNCEMFIEMIKEMSVLYSIQKYQMKEFFLW